MDDQKKSLTKPLIRLFVALWVIVVSIEVTPWNLGSWDRVKQPVNKVLNNLGLWQGQWRMFAPTPWVNNWWLSATIDTADSQEQWQSPYWGEVSSAEKFRRFRYMNYYNRIQLRQYRRAARDFAAFLRHNRMLDAYRAVPRDQPAVRVQLFTNGVDPVMPADGSLPPFDELVWVSFSRLIAEAR